MRNLCFAWQIWHAYNSNRKLILCIFNEFLGATSVHLDAKKVMNEWSGFASSACGNHLCASRRRFNRYEMNLWQLWRQQRRCHWSLTSFSIIRVRKRFCLSVFLLSFVFGGNNRATHILTFTKTELTIIQTYYVRRLSSFCGIVTRWLARSSRNIIIIYRYLIQRGAKNGATSSAAHWIELALLPVYPYHFKNEQKNSVTWKRVRYHQSVVVCRGCVCVCRVSVLAIKIHNIRPGI